MNDYKSKYIRVSAKSQEINSEIQQINSEIAQDSGQFFTMNEHKIFEKKYHRANSQDLKRIRKEVRDKFIKIHNIIYPQFKNYGLINLHCHHNSREIVSRHFFNQYSGNDYWTNIEHIPSIENIVTPEELHIYTQKESIDNYFIMGRDINWLDVRLSKTNIANTILQEFR